MARKNKGHAEHENHERWLITYADLITLLMIFFVILYSMSKIDQSKYEVLVQALKTEFMKSDSMIQGGSGFIGRVSMNPSTEGANTTKSPSKDDVLQAAQEISKEEREKQLQDLLQKVQDYIEEQNLQTQVSAANTPRGVAVTLNDLFLFDLGKAELKKEAFPILNQLASLFPTLNATISIEGHTDNLPITTGSIYRDNWGLSNERSLSVLRYFIYNKGMEPAKLMSTGYADTRPVADNNTPENRSKNRRVEIVVLR